LASELTKFCEVSFRKKTEVVREALRRFLDQHRPSSVRRLLARRHDDKRI
jgi:hypothetical protein